MCCSVTSSAARANQTGGEPLGEGRVGENMHLVFTAVDRAAVREFYDAALSAGGTAVLSPDLHPEYHQDYYGAFVLDPDGINLEAVCHLPESALSS